METEYLTAKEAARILKLSYETLRQWRKRKVNLPYCKVGCVRYTRRDIDEFMERNKVIPEGE